MDIEVYNVYSKDLKERFGEKVYKLPINLPLTCPNRDGTRGCGGCIYCGDEGGSFENLPKENTVRQQIEENMDYISRRYKARKFIAYFQNFTNTYMPLEDFKIYMKEAIQPNIVGISVSTRPDCIDIDYLEYLKELEEAYAVEITIELGLQTVNYKTLDIINRGHGLAEFIDSVIRIRSYGFRICTHLILNLPWDDMRDVVENSKIISSLGVDEIKLHALYVVENTRLGKLYKAGELELISKEEYIERVVTFLSYLHEDVVVQRIIGRAPEEGTLFVNWNESWWKIRDEIVETMIERKLYQGIKCDYLNGPALRDIKYSGR